MDTSRTSSYVSLSIKEIRQRFEELKDDDLAALSLEDGEVPATQAPDGYDPYGRN